MESGNGDNSKQDHRPYHLAYEWNTDMFHALTWRSSRCTGMLWLSINQSVNQSVNQSIIVNQSIFIKLPPTSSVDAASKCLVRAILFWSWSHDVKSVEVVCFTAAAVDVYGLPKRFRFECSKSDENMLLAIFWNILARKCTDLTGFGTGWLSFKEFSDIVILWMTMPSTVKPSDTKCWLLDWVFLNLSSDLGNVSNSEYGYFYRPYRVHGRQLQSAKHTL